MGPREQRRQQVLEVHREHLLDAAEQVFAEKGFQDATIKEIAERAEFSVVAVS
jgi:AcrR family transcriptional regulator